MTDERLGSVADQRRSAVAKWLGGAGPWFLGALVLVNVSAALHLTQLRQERDENLLVHASNRPELGPRYDWSVGEDLPRYLAAIPDARQQPLVLVMGMSQMYAINDKQPTDQAIPELLDEALAPAGIRAFGLVAPNLNNEEALLLQLVGLLEPATTPRALIHGVCFDKFRNIDLRPALSKVLQSTPALQQQWRVACEGREERYPLACQKMSNTLRLATEATAQQGRSWERRITDQVARVLPLVAARTELNGALQRRLGSLRNWVFGIDARSKRPLLEARFTLNQQLLGLLVEVLQARGVAVVLYVVPLNPQAQTPYVEEQYDAFKQWLQRFSEERTLAFANLEDAVPVDDWGYGPDGPDFKHFRGVGHRQTVQAILTEFAPALEAATGKDLSP